MWKNADTTGLQPRGVSVSTWRANQLRLLDTTDFSRVEVQFLRNFAPPKKAKTKLHTSKVGSIQKDYQTPSTSRLKLKHHAAGSGLVRAPRDPATSRNLAIEQELCDWCRHSILYRERSDRMPALNNQELLKRWLSAGIRSLRSRYCIELRSCWCPSSLDRLFIRESLPKP